MGKIYAHDCFQKHVEKFGQVARNGVFSPSQITSHFDQNNQ